MRRGARYARRRRRRRESARRCRAFRSRPCRARRRDARSGAERRATAPLCQEETAPPSANGQDARRSSRRDAARSPWRRPGAARRHGQDRFAVARMNAQRVTPRAAMPAQPNREDLRAVLDREVEKVRRAADREAREWPCLQIRGIRDRPDSAISAASEIARRKNKSFAQYTGAKVAKPPYRMGFGTKISASNDPFGSAQRMRNTHSFIRPANPAFPAVNSGGYRAPSNQRRITTILAIARSATIIARAIPPQQRPARGFGLAADSMKSEMRGTISDLNREPLNTP